MFRSIDFNNIKIASGRILLFVPLIVFAFLAASVAYADQKEPAASYQDQYDEIFKAMSEKFYDKTRIENELPPLFEKYREKALSAESEIQFAGIVNEMLRELHVSHTYFLTPGDVEYYWLGDIFSRFLPEEIFKGQDVEYPSIGVITSEIEDKTFVMTVLPGGPADSAGILAGDEIATINGERYTPVDSLREHVGKEVELTVKHTEDEEIAIPVTPVLVNPGNEMLAAQENSVKIIESEGKKIGYIHIFSYAGEKYHEQLVESIAWGAFTEADALIIDLRYGLGGANPSYLDIFNENVPVIVSQDNTGRVYTFDSKWRKPAVYLVNNTTRSGKELLVYGAQKFKLATVIGEQTAGAVMGGQIHALANGNLLYIASRKSLSDDRMIEGNGVTPDVVVPMDIRYSQGNDIQIEESVKYLVNEING